MRDRGVPDARPARWLRLGLPLTVLVLLVAGLATYLGTRDHGVRPVSSAPAAGTAVPSSQLAGEWSGEGTVTRCAGFPRCAGTRSVTLTIDCSAERCEVVPFDSRYGSPPLRFSDGRYRAVGPLPAGVAPTCGGAPTSTALWRLELVPRDGRLTGSYAESTQQSFDCGGTGVAWQVDLHRT